MSSIPMIYRPDQPEFNPDLAVGSFWWRDYEGYWWFHAIMPGTVHDKTPTAYCAVPVQGGPALPKAQAWDWDGNIERPTLTPSLWLWGRKGWHGHVTAGVMIMQPDTPALYTA